MSTVKPKQAKPRNNAGNTAANGTANSAGDSAVASEFNSSSRTNNKSSKNNVNNAATVTNNNSGKNNNSNSNSGSNSKREGKGKDHTKTAVTNSANQPALKIRSREVEKFGIVYALKGTFGFIQPVFDEEQVYFSEKEFYPGLKIGDKVGYLPRNGHKGVNADNVRNLIPQTEKLIPNVQGIVSRTSDHNRAGLGLVTVDVSKLSAASLNGLDVTKFETVPFRMADIDSNTIPHGYKLEEGDKLSFTLSRVHDSSFYLVTQGKFISSKKTMASTDMIQRMLDAGAKREMGVVTSVIKGEYGFVKALDRKEELYFRLDTMVDGKKIREGSEIEFFVIAESVRGKITDRAVHVTHLPSGTVKLETLIARDIVAKVIARNISSSNEETPGIARVFDTINVMGMPEVDLGADPSKGIISGLSPDGVLSSVQLWQRCMPDDLTLRVGDDVQIDVAYYRPDKLFFARNVRISKFRRIAREFGNICSLKEHGFGFIHSSIRSSDLYFKTSQVIGLNGLPEQEANLSVDMMVSYDVVIEETNNGYKLRAYRIKVEDPVAIEMENNSKFLLKKDVIGYIAKISTKKDVAGVIKIFPQFVESVQSLEYQEPEIVEALTEFKAMDELSQINLYGLPNALLLTYYTIIEEMFSGSLVHETAPIDKNDPNMGKTLKILKVTPEEYEFWRSTNKKLRSNADGKKRDDKADDVEGSVPVKILRQVKNRKDTIQYFKEEYISEEFGPLANDLKVMFDICWDKNRLKKVAKSVRQTEELIPDCPGIQYGVIEVALEKGAKFGFIRTIPTDEKLFWHVSSAGAIAVKNLHLGSEVSFEMRRRGGLRSAVNIQSLPTGALRKEEILEGLCSAIVMENNLLFLLDPLAIREFVGKYLDLKVLVIVLQCMTMKPSKPTRSDEAWDRASILKDNAELLAEESSAGSALTDGSQQGFTLDATVNEGTHFLNESPPVNEQIESSGNAKAKCAIDGIALGLTDSDEKLHHDSDGDGTKEFNIEYKPKFFPLLYRSPVGIDPAFTAVAENDGETKPESGGSYKAQVGDYILCSLLVDWSLQRSPIRAVNLNVVDNNDEGVNRRKGRINRIKFRLKPSIIENSKELLQSYNSNCVWDEDKSLATITTMDMVEIMLVEEKTKEQRLQELANFQENADKDKLLYYYCDFREINVLDENARDFPQVGDTVEFWSMKTYGPLALGVTLLPKPKDLINFSVKRPTVNTDLKVNPNQIIMANGPPNDAASGFEAGWRSVDCMLSASALSQLPWSGMLGHLLATSAPSTAEFSTETDIPLAKTGTQLF